MVSFVMVSLIKHFYVDAKEYLKIYFDCSYSMQWNGLMICQGNGFITVDLFFVLLTVWK